MTTIQKARRVRGCVRLPGDKSISHRAGLIAALAEGETDITGFATSEDCHSTLQCLRALGVRIEINGTHVRVHGAETEASVFRAPARKLDCGNSGSTMRMLAGILAWQSFTATMTGDASLSARPMTRIITPLAQMGARIEARDGRAPLIITGRALLRAISYELPVASAQVKSAVLLAGLGGDGRTEVIESIAPTRDHTERMLRLFGASIGVKRRADEDDKGDVISIDGGAKLYARPCCIPGDVSSAAFLIAAAVMLDDSELRIEAVGLNPTRTQFIRTLQMLGADITIENQREESGEPVGDIIARGRGRLPAAQGSRGIIRGAEIANLIDELPMLAVLATHVTGGLVVREAKELRVKETDRIRAVVENLRRMNADVEEYTDGFAIRCESGLRGAHLKSYADHRIAMAFSVAALTASGETRIDGAECVAVSFPNFYELLASIIEH
ncbi:MAG: 3-phosphoshikimate 1-carboxyvinyltransferase [Pyrinomonadaceae bacterium MAG19_C2-C3]|nr:3-phosphoshikimate 1-carboxyvinyltransferase [Pyrinomonadaceae bacterium MAG19_C2-C3]